MHKDIFDTDAFYAALDAHRDAKGLNWKQVAAATGLGASTLTRLAQGKKPDVDGLSALLKWSGLAHEDFLVDNEKRNQPDTLAMISTLLRKDRKLGKEGAEAIQQIVKAAYRQLKKRR